MSNTYCTRAQIEDRYGTTNVSDWADLDNDANAATIAGGITRAIDVVSDKIDDTLRRSPYRIALSTPAGATPTQIVDIAANLAGAWLYKSRGVEDFDNERGVAVHKLSGIEGEAMRQLNDIKTGRVPLDAL